MKDETIKGYKGFDKNLCCRGFQYEVGQTYEINEPISLCDCGFHFCRNIFDVHRYYTFNNADNRYCEVEILGDVIDDDNKSVTNKIKIVREISKDELMGITNIGSKNSGYCNTGNRNTGDYNTGDWNTGYRNTGDCNTGDWNTGYRNTGDSNTGDCNTGNCNTGDSNTGNRNTGYRNTGDCNTGDCNTGNWNTGDWNTGDWNKTNRSAGVFCTEEPKLIMFNKETNINFSDWRKMNAYYILNGVQKSEWVYYDDMTEEEKEKNPSAKTSNGYLKEIPRKEASENWWKNLNDREKKEIFNLPNFDLDIFNEIMELNISYFKRRI